MHSGKMFIAHALPFHAASPPQKRGDAILLRHRRILLFPRGNQRKHEQSLSAYLDCPDLDQEEPGWTLRTSFDIVLVHPDDESKNIFKSERIWMP